MAADAAISCHSSAHVCISPSRALPPALSMALAASVPGARTKHGGSPGKVDANLRVEQWARQDEEVRPSVRRWVGARTTQEPARAGTETLAPGDNALDRSCGRVARLQSLSSTAASRMPRFARSGRARATASSGAALGEDLEVAHVHAHGLGPGIAGWPKAGTQAPACPAISAAAWAVRLRQALARLPPDSRFDWHLVMSCSTSEQYFSTSSLPSMKEAIAYSRFYTHLK
ncbi:hypothetical protein A9A59_2422 [Tepidiforma thermophila]|uniref:Uncharacterized protein n=1 Tax=Tepidiforma thermophila (strain KCTC 52669 / CGMCC 1.13589 / G233) TaxID=2761530 RepID=A0A2A9HJH9_TEPT2|nr:hypothetical protein A9A59_2422 [Tepidiforma thermophila]